MDSAQKQFNGRHIRICAYKKEENTLPMTSTGSPPRPETQTVSSSCISPSDNFERSKHFLQVYFWKVKEQREGRDNKFVENSCRLLDSLVVQL